MGEKIQGGVDGKEYGFVLFDIRLGRIWQTSNDVAQIGALLSVKTPEILYQLNIKDIQQFDEKTFEGIEGFVIRPIDHVYLRANGDRIILKLTKKHYKNLVKADFLKFNKQKD